jgi:hypothetical protein
MRLPSVAKSLKIKKGGDEINVYLYFYFSNLLESFSVISRMSMMNRSIRSSLSVSRTIIEISETLRWLYIVNK